MTGRLIDADAVEKITWEDSHYYDPLNVLTEVREKVRALPTVDAIPVEWIKKYMSRCLAIEQDAIGEMVKEWAERKEE